VVPYIRMKRPVPATGMVCVPPVPVVVEKTGVQLPTPSGGYRDLECLGRG
jgi:hypothetical protein